MIRVKEGLNNQLLEPPRCVCLCEISSNNDALISGWLVGGCGCACSLTPVENALDFAYEQCLT